MATTETGSYKAETSEPIATPLVETVGTTDPHVTAFASIQDGLFASDTAGSGWDPELYQKAASLISTEGVPKMILLRTLELLAKYAKRFPQLSKDVYATFSAFTTSEDPGIKTQANKFIDQFYVAGGVGEYSTLITSHAPSLLKKRFEAPDDSQAEKDLLDKMVAGDIASVVKSCAEILHHESSVDLEPLREYVLKFLVQIIRRNQKTTNSSTELIIKSEIEKLLCIVSKQEFNLLIQGLTALKIADDAALYGKQGLVGSLVSSIDTLASVDPCVTWKIERTMGIISQTVKYMKNANITDGGLTKYLVDKWVTPEGVFSGLAAAHQLVILKRLAEVSGFATSEDAVVALNTFYPWALASLPNTGEVDGNEAYQIQEIEAILLTLSLLGKKAKDTWISLTGQHIADDKSAAAKAKADTVKTQEDVDKSLAARTKFAAAHDLGSHLSGQLNEIKSELNGKAKLFEKADLQAKFTILNRSLANVNAVVALSAPIKEVFAYFSPKTYGTWQPINNNNNRGHKRNASSDNKNAQGGKGGAKGGAKGAGPQSNDNKRRRK